MTIISKHDESEGAHIALILVRGLASPRRVECEIAAIRQAVKPRGAEIHLVVCEPRELGAKLRGVQQKRVWVHVAGHACETSSPARNGGEQILHLHATAGHLELKRATVTPPLSFGDMLATLSRIDGVELVFFNASETKQLADRVAGAFAFGWASTCLDQGAIAFATAFYSALRGKDFAKAFGSACSLVAHGKAKLSTPVRDAEFRAKIADPHAWLAARKRKRETPLEAGIVPGIGRTKLDKLGRYGITTVQALAELDPDDDTLVRAGACRSRDTLRKWRDSASSQLLLQQEQPC